MRNRITQEIRVVPAKNPAALNPDACERRRFRVRHGFDRVLVRTDSQPRGDHSELRRVLFKTSSALTRI